jgi:hypothetical protein
MAQGLNAKLGPLVYASNHAPAEGYFSVFGVSANRGATNGSVTTTNEIVSKIPLNLFPQKVKSQATVYAVFALE